MNLSEIFRVISTFVPVFMGFLVAQTVKNLPAMQETWLWSLGWEGALEEGMATHSSILAWRIPRLQSMRSQRVGCDWATKHSTVARLLNLSIATTSLLQRQENPKPSVWSGTHRNLGQRKKSNSHFWGFFPLQKTQTTSSGLHSGEFRGLEQVMFSGTFLYYDSMWVNEL